MMKNKILIIFLGIFLISNIISATPIITINSPTNSIYDSNKVSLSVTSNEPVDFFIKNEGTGKKIILEENTNNLESYLYVKEGSYTYTIWANNSNGETNASVVFGSSIHNPVNITSCGILLSPDTAYVLNSDISTTSIACLYLHGVRNTSLNLNGYTLNSGTSRGLSISYSSDVTVQNGTIKGSDVGTGGTLPWIIGIEGSKMIFRNLNISGYTGISAYPITKIYFENVNINSSIGFWYTSNSDIHFINSSITWNGKGNPETSTAFLDQSDYSEIILQETNITGFPNYDFYLKGTAADIYLRNSNIDMEKIHYSEWTADARILKQHLIIINIIDQFNLTGACSVQVLDNEILPRYEGLDTNSKALSNPTAKFYIPTGETGQGQAWVTEKLTLARSSSPAVVTEYDFSNYTLTTRGWGSDNYSQINLNLTGHNSTIYVNFPITTAGGGELPQCTITQMLDLNNDGYVNILDATIVLRKITGLSVSVNTTKECNGINLDAF